jgi:predicted nucleic acid-binding protein
MRRTTMTKFALDTNILIYSHNKDNVHRQNIARNQIVKSPVISAQVVSEYINVLKRIIPVSKNGLLDLCMPVIRRCTIILSIYKH